MIGIFKSARRKQREQAEQWIHLARKVFHYRRDLLSEADLLSLTAATKRLEDLVRRKDSTPSQVDEAIQHLDATLRPLGAGIHPRGFWGENVEMVVVAAILALGVRAFFFQPFKIPTNSMYPTYNGMTYVLHAEDSPPPGPLAQAARLAAFGAVTYRVVAPADGELLIPLFSPGERRTVNSEVRGSAVRGRKWWVVPATLAEHTFLVGQREVSLRVPHEFVFNKVVAEAFVQDNRDRREEVLPGIGRVLRTGRHFRKGQTVLSFEVLTGDALFVDRFTYHFRPPKVGDPFVFRTDNIRQIEREHLGKYYIKRLAGEGGDTLEVRAPVLLRNGEPIEGARAFERNQLQQGEYEGYTNMGLLAPGRVLAVPDGHYFAMGDNSDESSDSRAWGFVPQRDVIGKAFFIYYPFTRRWGPTH